MKIKGSWFLKRKELFQTLYKDKKLQSNIVLAHSIILSALEKDNKILIFGNGGSAAEAQHFAAELVCQFGKKRKALPVISLTTDSSILTAQSNDYGFSSVFQRQIEALCQSGDVVIGLTTSDATAGHSENILKAFQSARKKGATSIGLFSGKTKKLKKYTDLPLIVPTRNTALVQEAHLVIIHILCGLIEENL